MRIENLFKFFNLIKDDVPQNCPTLVFFCNAFKNALACDCGNRAEIVHERYKNLVNDLQVHEKEWLFKKTNSSEIELIYNELSFKLK